MIADRVERLSPAHVQATLAYLDGAPYDNVFLSWLIAGGSAHSGGATSYVFFDGTSRIRGAAYFGRQAVLAADDEDVVRALAQLAPLHRFERMIVGPRRVVQWYWEIVKAWHAPPRIVRERQPLLAVTAQTLQMQHGTVRVRRARRAESEAIAKHSAQMIDQELGYNPRHFPDFTENVRRMIDRGLWWVGIHDGRLCFVCNAGPFSEKTLQLQGIWTPPALRRRGLAAAALSGICAQLLQSFPSLSLYVNDFNTAALALYARLGFTTVGEFSTLLF